MAPKFGTSGLRGLVTELTPDLVADHVAAFLEACDVGAGLCIGRDLRPSSPRIADDVAAAARALGVPVVDCGEVPTPALALAARRHGMGAVMVTGSHIPADRNGLKFYTVAGEITKLEEEAITARLTGAHDPAPELAPLSGDEDAGQRFVERYVQGFGAAALKGRRIGLYSHSAVGRDLVAQILCALGAVVVELGRSDSFIPVDTEAVDPQTRAQISDWIATHKLDALVSTDGDSDRPLLADERGRIVPGDVIGQIASEALGADHVVTPISSNSGVMRKGFAQVVRTKIGSPHVVAAMEALGGKVVGYEANGGFLLGFRAQGPAGPLDPLMTRDCVLPVLLALTAAPALAPRVDAEPPVITLADRLQEVPHDISAPFIAALADDETARQSFLAEIGGTFAALDLTDGVRMTLESGEVVHVRRSGNAPELRLYVESEDRASAETLMTRGLAALRTGLAATESR